jgi:thiosulfate/3-mercaptopyruvate sulfurtransferase
MSHPILVSTDWLHKNLDKDDVRVFDCTTVLRPDPERTFVVESGKAAYDDGHIPGAGFLDLQGELSAKDSQLRFTLPTESEFADAVGAKGIGNEHHLVLYSTTNPMWATRMWWMFRIHGHENVSILDGGFNKWKQEGKPIETAEPVRQPTTYNAVRDHSRVADKAAVLEAIEQPEACVINALSREQFSGGGANYGRPGRIRNSQSIPWTELIDDAGCFLPQEELADRLGTTTAAQATRVIHYCGGGIAASMSLFAMALLGREEDVALYDNSLSEWAADDSLPMETD